MLAVAGIVHRLHDPLSTFQRGALGEPFDTPARVDALLGALRGLGADSIEPVEHADDAVLAVHTADLVAHLRDGWALARAEGAPGSVVPDVFPHVKLVPARARGASGGRAAPGAYCFDCSSPLLAGTWAAAREAADVALTAADAVLSGERVVYALCRPPGHHAGRDFYGGFCYLNNAAIAAVRLRAEHERVAVIDLDIHHGNGTQAVFWEDASVLTVSIHEHPSFGYPYYTGYEDERGAGAGTGANVNLPLQRGCDDDAFVSVVADAARAVNAFGADAVVVALGLDGLDDDPLSDARLTPTAYERAAGVLKTLGSPVVVVQEGGYALGTIAAALSAFLGSIADD